MPVRLTLDLEFSVSSTTADEKDLGNGKFFLRTDAFGEGGTWKTTIVATTVDQQFILDNVAVGRFLLIRVHPVSENDPGQAISVKLNDTGNTAIEIVPPDDKKDGYFVITTDNLTALYVTNAGSVDVNLTIAVAGD